MPLNQLTTALTDGQKLEVLKRFRATYAEELVKLESEMQDILIAVAEADFLTQYLGEQPEVSELRKRKADLEVKEKRRQYLGKIIDRLDQSIPQQQPVNVSAPNSNNRDSGKNSALRRF